MSEYIQSATLQAEHRTYFFDLIKGDKPGRFLKITESKRNDEDFERFNVLVDAKFLDKFLDCLFQLREVEHKLKNKDKTDAQRSEYSNAYKPWTIEDDGLLEKYFCEGKTTKELSAIFGRNNGAIRSRIKKLELTEKYS